MVDKIFDITILAQASISAPDQVKTVITNIKASYLDIFAQSMKDNRAKEIAEHPNLNLNGQGEEFIKAIGAKYTKGKQEAKKPKLISATDQNDILMSDTGPDSDPGKSEGFPFLMIRTEHRTSVQTARGTQRKLKSTTRSSSNQYKFFFFSLDQTAILFVTYTLNTSSVNLNRTQSSAITNRDISNKIPPKGPGLWCVNLKKKKFIRPVLGLRS